MNTDQPTKQTATGRYPEQPHTASTRAGCYNTLGEQAQKAVGRAAHRTNLLALVLFLLLLGVGTVLLFALPEHIEPIVLLPLGYPADESVFEGEKKRKTLTEIYAHH